MMNCRTLKKCCKVSLRMLEGINGARSTSCIKIRLRVLSFAAFLIFVQIVTASVWAQAPQAPPTVVFMTDFGTADDSVALCKGVMYSVLPTLRVVDLSHQVAPFSVLDGARYLYGS